jgi:hypothetical protein
MANTFKLAARHGDMFTFERSVDGKPTDYLRGFGATEQIALEDARSELVDASGMLMYRKPFAAPWTQVAKCLTY